MRHIEHEDLAPRETLNNFHSYGSDPHADSMQPGADDSLDADLQILERCAQSDDDDDAEYRNVRKRVLWLIAASVGVVLLLWAVLG